MSSLGEECTGHLGYYFLKALLEYYQGNTPSSKKLLQEVLRRDPDHLQCQQLLKQLRRVEKFKDQGNELLKQGKLDEAIEQYSQGLEQDSSNNKLNAILLSNRALCYLKQDKLE